MDVKSLLFFTGDWSPLAISRAAAVSFSQATSVRPRLVSWAHSRETEQLFMCNQLPKESPPNMSDLEPGCALICFSGSHSSFRSVGEVTFRRERGAEDPPHLFLDGLEAAKDATGAMVDQVDGEHCLLDGMLEDETRPGGYHCSQCDRVLMSMQGLRSHERSHLALAKLCSFKSSYNSRLKTHILKAHAGEHAYKCSWCSFSTMTISQLKEHSLKVHGKALTLPRPRIVSLLSSHSHHSSQKATPAEEVEDSNVWVSIQSDQWRSLCCYT